MKTIKFTLIVLVAFLASCSPEPVAPIETDIRNEITGTWKCEQAAKGEEDNPTYYENVKISKDTNSNDKIKIENFHQVTGTILATIKEDRSVILAKQTLTDGTEVEGTVNINSDYTKITWDYTATGDGEKLIFKATYTTGDAPAKRLK